MATTLPNCTLRGVTRISSAILLVFVAALVLAAIAARSAGAQTAEIISRNSLRVCADPANLPSSNKAEEGFENRIAQLLADDLGLPVTYTWFPQGMGFVRNTLMARKCDVVIGISLGHELLQNTNPYYRSSYALIYRSDLGHKIESLDDPVLSKLRLGVVAGTPPSSILAKRGLLDRVRPYQLMVDTRHENSGQAMVNDLLAGEIDLGILWGPIAGYHAKLHAPDLFVVPLEPRPNEVRVDSRITMGLRFNEPNWKRTLNGFLTRRRTDIEAILADYGVPLLNDRGALITASGKTPSPPTVAEPSGYRLEDLRAPVPATITGGRTVTTREVEAMAKQGRAVLVDVMFRAPRPAGLEEGTLWRPRPRRNIPGSTWLVNTGFGALSEEAERYLRDGLARLTSGDQARPLVFYCLSDCWMSWNAAKRAISYGYRDVNWYPDGTDGWREAGLPTEASEPMPAEATQ